MISRVVLVRHGQTEGNVAGLWQGQSDTPLTELGLTQAQLLGERLKGEVFDVVLSSDLTRSVRTTALVMTHHAHLSPVYLKEVREHAIGVFELQPKAVYEEARIAFESSNPGKEFVPPGGESEQQFRSRVQRVHDLILDTYPGKTVLVSAHGGFNAMFIAHALHYSDHERRTVVQDSCCVNSLVFRGRDLDREASVINCTKHLRHDARTTPERR